MSFWPGSPVPLSPMTAKRSDPSFSGSASAPVAAAEAGGDDGRRARRQQRAEQQESGAA